MKRRDKAVVVCINALLRVFASREYRLRLHRAIADGLAYQLGVEVADRPHRPASESEQRCEGCSKPIDPETAWCDSEGVRLCADCERSHMAEVESEQGERGRWTGPADIAWCPEHGLHGARDTCFECGKPVEQIRMVPLDEQGED